MLRQSLKLCTAGLLIATFVARSGLLVSFEADPSRNLNRNVN